MRRALDRARLAAGIVPYLARPLEPATALAAVREDVARREKRFLALVRELLGDPASPHRHLLHWAGWDAPRLERSVRAAGLEATLGELCDAGVRTSFQEFRCRVPIVRHGLTLPAEPAGFDHPAVRRRRVRVPTSGTTGAVAEVPYGWPLFHEEAALECLLLESHGLLDAPCALWLPGLPSIAGLHNLVVHLGFRRPPERWFTQSQPSGEQRLAVRGLRAAARAFGLRVPPPAHVPYAEAETVARWLAGARDRSGRAALKTFASSAVRVAEAALGLGLDLDGCVLFVGGEPLTERRRAYIESSGAHAVPRYVATETGWIAGGCPETAAAAHLYTNRLAAVPARDGSGTLLFTSISAAAGKVLLNTDLGDQGTLSAAACSCGIRAAGLGVMVAGVSSAEKISLEGVTLPRALLDEVVEEVVGAAGGPPDAHVLAVREDAEGRWRAIVTVDAELPLPAEAELADRILERLSDRSAAGRVAAEQWRASGVLAVVRGAVRPGPSAKLRSRVAAGA